MMLKRFLSKTLLAVFALSLLTVPAFAAEGDGTAAAGDTAAQSQPPQVVFNYKYTSARYGYSIFCPTQPKVMPASAYNEDDKGDVLIFSGSYNDIKKGWIICMNGYDDAVIPANLGTMEEEEARAFLRNFAATYGMDYAQIIEVENTNPDGTPAEGVRYGICGPSASQVEIDTDGDGVMDAVAVAETHMLKLFLPGQYGGHFVMGLIADGELSQYDVTEFMNATIYTFQEWPTSTYNKAKEEAAKNNK